MTTDMIPVAGYSIWKPIRLGSDEFGRRVEVTLLERNMLIGGEPGGGQSVALQLIVAHGALSPGCRLILIDGERVELGLRRDCADKFIGLSIDDAIDVMRWLQGQSPATPPQSAHPASREYSTPATVTSSPVAELPTSSPSRAPGGSSAKKT